MRRNSISYYHRDTCNVYVEISNGNVEIREKSQQKDIKLGKFNMRESTESVKKEVFFTVSELLDETLILF